MLGFNESSQFQWSCPSPWEHLCCISSQTFGGHWACDAMDKVTQGAPSAQWLRCSRCSLRVERNCPLGWSNFLSCWSWEMLLTMLRPHQVSTKLKFSINCCVIGNCNMTCWEPSFLAHIFERNNCILLTVANSLSPDSSLVLPCRRAIWEFVFIFQVLVA